MTTLFRSIVFTALATSLVVTACSTSPPPDVAATAAAPVVASQEPDQAPPGRLPKGVRPLAYRLDLVVDPRRDDFGGRVEIDVELDAPARRIWLHGKGLDVTSASAEVADGRTFPAEYSEVLPSGVAALRFGEELPAGTATLRLEYRADFDRNLAGLFKVEEQGDAYALAKSESIQARSYLPGFDEPGLKATFDIRLTIPEGQTAIGNTLEIDRQPAGEGLQTVTFAQTLPMSTYLLSLAVGPFDVVERDAIAPSAYRSQPIPLRGVARKGRGGDLGYILGVTPRMVEIFEEQLQRPYPFDKLDIVAAPAWPSGATELSAAITYREQLILVGDDPAPGARLALIGVHSHEIAHMWLGNLVTPPWWDDLWLKEGFATWASPVVLSILEPDGGHDLDGAAKAIGAMTIDSLASTRAIREPIVSNETIRNAYDSITYSKSLGVIHMVDQYFGAERFRPALGRYIETFAGGAADSDDFYRVIGEETGTPALTETFRSFVEQKGVPQLDLEVSCDAAKGNSVKVTQHRYRPLGSPIEDTLQLWSIPFCLRTDEGARHCEMLTKAEQTLRLADSACPAWILPNAGGGGYYRWNLGDDRWRALIDHFADLTPVEALSVVDSAFAAFEAGSMSEANLLRVVEQTAKVETRQIVTAPLAYLNKYIEAFAGDGDRAALLGFLRPLYLPVLERTAESSDADQRLLHSNVRRFMALTARDPEIREPLLAAAHAFTGYGVERDASALDSDLYSAALTVALQDSKPDFLPHLVALRSQLDDPRFKAAAASAIGSITNPEQLDTVHELALSDQLGPREAAGLIIQMAAEPALRDQHWQWIQDHFAEVVAKMPAQWRARVPNLGNGFCSEQKLDELRRLFAEHGDLTPGYEQILDQTEETITLCIALRDRGRSLIAGV